MISLVERLRLGGPNAWEVYGEAADVIERLQREVEYLNRRCNDYADQCIKLQEEIRLLVTIRRD